MPSKEELVENIASDAVTAYEAKGEAVKLNDYHDDSNEVFGGGEVIEEAVRKSLVAKGFIVLNWQGGSIVGKTLAEIATWMQNTAGSDTATVAN